MLCLVRNTPSRQHVLTTARARRKGYESLCVLKFCDLERELISVRLRVLFHGITQLLQLRRRLHGAGAGARQAPQDTVTRLTTGTQILKLGFLDTFVLTKIITTILLFQFVYDRAVVKW